MAYFSQPNILELRKSELEEPEVRQAFAFEYHPPCPSHCSSSPLHITFYIHSRQRFYDSSRVSSSSSLDSSAMIGEYYGVVGEKTICQDGSLFFEIQENDKSKVVVSTVLDSLKVKESLHDEIFKKVMAFGQEYNKVSNEKKVLEGLVVCMTFLQSFIGDRVSVHEALEKSFEESKSEACGESDLFIHVK